MRVNPDGRDMDKNWKKGRTGNCNLIYYVRKKILIFNKRKKKIFIKIIRVYKSICDYIKKHKEQTSSNKTK